MGIKRDPVKVAERKARRKARRAKFSKALDELEAELRNEIDDDEAAALQAEFIAGMRVLGESVLDDGKIDAGEAAELWRRTRQLSGMAFAALTDDD